MLPTSTASFTHYWKHFTKHFTTTKMPLVRLDSSSSTSSSCSAKSVSFQDLDTVYYTHSSVEYDRSAMSEPRMSASLGRIFLTESEQQAIVEDSPQQDTIVERNTFANARRGIEGYAVMRQIRSR